MDDKPKDRSALWVILGLLLAGAAVVAAAFVFVDGRESRFGQEDQAEQR